MGFFHAQKEVVIHMASRIQGITVEIGGDTTKLSKALESVNKSIKGMQSGLKDVNKLLKLDPSNTELVVQKQKMLKDAIEATKEKLATLKTAAQQANEQLANGEITQQQYDALQREIVETEQNLRSLQDQAATTNATLAKIDEAGEKLQNIGSSVENVGKKFLPVTAAVTGLGTAAVKTAADFDSEMSKVSAISGATGDDFDQLRAKAREMGAKTKFSASEAASAMEYMAMAGWKTSDMLNGIEGIMNLAAASGEDLATTSDIVTDALTAFGLSAADSGHFADILAAASSNANTNVSMMGETFKYCAPIAGALGFSAEDTAEAIGLMVNSGIKTLTNTSWNGIKTVITTAWNSIKSLTTSSVTAVRSTVTSGWNSLKSTTTSAFNGIKSTVSSAMSSLRSTVSSGVASIRNSFNSLGSIASSAYRWGADICSQMAAGVRAAASSVIAAAENVASRVRSLLHFSVPDEGPLSNADTYMPDFMKLLATGIKKNVKSVVKAVQGLAGSMSSNLTTPVDSLGDWMDSVVGSFATTIKKSQSGIGSAARDVGSGIQSQLMSGLSGLKTQFQQSLLDFPAKAR